MNKEPLLLYVDEAYKVLFGKYPPHQMLAWERMSWVMESWDGRKFDRHMQGQIIARLALCQIGLHWHPTDGLPYDFPLIAGRLEEFTPELVCGEVDGRVMRTVMTKILKDHRVPVRHP